MNADLTHIITFFACPSTGLYTICVFYKNNGKFFMLRAFVFWRYILVIDGKNNTANKQREVSAMKKITYTISDKNGIHARPAGLIVQCAKKYNSDITMTINERSADCKKLFAVMGLGAVCGSIVLISADGEDETGAIDDIENTMRGAGL